MNIQEAMPVPATEAEQLPVEQERRKRRIIHDLVAYYHEHYEGLTRGALHRADPSFYLRLWKAGLLTQHVPSSKPHVRPSHYGDNPVAYYHEHHEGLTRGQLSRADGGLYKRLLKNGMLEHVPLHQGRFGADPLAYYQEHYAGMNRTELRKVDLSLYQELWRKKLLDMVPMGTAQRIIPDALAYYRTHYEGLTSRELLRRDPCVYAKLRKNDQLAHVPQEPEDDIKETCRKLMEEYRTNYDGLTRGRLQKTDRKLYNKLKYRGLLELIPTIQQKRDLGDPLQYYRIHYDGLTRGELQRTDRSLYQCMYLQGLLSHVPSKRKQNTVQEP